MINRLLELVSEFADGKKTVFAQNAGIPKGTFYGYLKGGSPHIEHLVRLSETYSVSIDWILTGRGSKYLSDQGAPQELDPDPEIAELMRGAQRVLSSGNPVAFDALERNIRYFDHAIAAEKRADEAEVKIKKMEEQMLAFAKELANLKIENQRLDTETEGPSSSEKVA